MTDFEIYEKILECKQKNLRCALATIVSTEGSTPAPLGAKILVLENGVTYGTVGGGCNEAQIKTGCFKAISDGKPGLLKLDYSESRFNGTKKSQICGGKIEVFIEPILPNSRLLIFGAGHIGQALSKMAKLVGFSITVIDDREEYANKERFPDADEILIKNFTDVFKDLNITNNSYIVIVTRGHKEDENVLNQLLVNGYGQLAKYIGMVGSSTKVKTIFDNLIKKGISPDLLKRVKAPIGIDIGSRTPEEIAVSILAQLISVKRGA